MKKSFLLVLLLSFMMVGCATQVSQKKIPEATQNQKTKTENKKIVASFYPLAFMAEKIVGDKAKVINLAGNQEVHDFIPSPRDMVKLDQADLVLVQGAELEPWAEDMLPQLKKKNIPVLEVSQGLTLHKMEEEDHHHEHEVDGHHEEEDEDEDEHGHHHHGEFDPHTWLDPVLAQDMVKNIAQKIVEIDPKNADFYKENAENLTKKLQEFDNKFQNLSCEKEESIISHDAFGYLARRYGFELHPIAGLSTHDEPSAKLLAELKEEAIEEGITSLLTEESSVKRFAETLARETGLEMLPVYTLENNSTSFFSGYKKNLSSIKVAFECQ